MGDEVQGLRRPHGEDDEEEQPAQRRRLAEEPMARVRSAVDEVAAASRLAREQVSAFCQTHPDLPMVVTTFQQWAAQQPDGSDERIMYQYYHSVLAELHGIQSRLGSMSRQMKITDANRAAWRTRFSTDDPVPPEKNTKKLLETYAYDVARHELLRRGYFQWNNMYYTRIETPEHHDTTAYEPAMTVAQFVAELMADTTTSQLHACRRHHLELGIALTKALQSYTGDCCPLLQSNRQVIAFRNGVLNVGEDRWVTYDEGIPGEWRNANRYIEEEFQFISPNEHAPWRDVLSLYIEGLLYGGDYLPAFLLSLVESGKYNDVAQARPLTVKDLADGMDLEELDNILSHCSVKHMSAIDRGDSDKHTWFRAWAADDLVWFLWALIADPDPEEMPLHLRYDMVTFIPKITAFICYQFTQRFSWETMVWFTGISIGRLWFPGESPHRLPYEKPMRDKWQIMGVFFGATGTGKSATVLAFATLFHPKDYGAISVAADANFCLSELNRYILWWMIPEMTDKTNIPLTTLNALISHDLVRINEKNEKAYTTKLGANGVACANGFPVSKHASRGSEQRRNVVGYFQYRIAERNGALEHAAAKQAPYFGHFAARAYLGVTQRVKTGDPLVNGPASLKGMHRASVLEQSEVARTLAEASLVRGDEDKVYITDKELRAALEIRGSNSELADYMNARLVEDTRMSGGKMKKGVFFCGVDIQKPIGNWTYSNGEEVRLAPMVKSGEVVTLDSQEYIPFEVFAERARATYGNLTDREIEGDLMMMGFRLQEETLPIRWRGRVYVPGKIVRGLVWVSE